MNYHEQSFSVIMLNINVVAGTLSVSADVTFTLEQNFIFTLTCISTGGPATTVTWTRDFVTVTGTQRSHVENGLTATYIHTLTLQYNRALIETRQLQGIYICSVVNAVSSANSPHLYIHGIQHNEHNVQCTCNTTFSRVAPSPPSTVSVSQNGLSSLLVSWPAREDLTATGYIIYYWQHQPQNLRLLLVEGADATSATITDLITGATYSISVASTSGTLPSTETTAPHDVTIGMYCS